MYKVLISGLTYLFLLIDYNHDTKATTTPENMAVINSVADQKYDNCASISFMKITLRVILLSAWQGATYFGVFMKQGEAGSGRQVNQGHSLQNFFHLWLGAYHGSVHVHI